MAIELAPKNSSTNTSPKMRKSPSVEHRSIQGGNAIASSPVLPGLIDPLQQLNIAHSSATTISGKLAASDPTNPTRTRSLKDDYLLTGLTTGQQVTVRMNSGFDNYLQLVNAATGQVITFNDDTNGHNAQITFTAQSGTDYLVRATSYASHTSGRYTLTTSANATPATPMTGNQRINGRLVASDPNDPLFPGAYYDGYLLTGVTAGQQVTVNLTAGFDTYLEVVNAATKQVIAFDDDSGDGLNSRLTFTALAGIDYIIQATSYEIGERGAYTLTTNTSNGVIPTITGDQTLSGTLSTTDPNNPIRNGSYSDDYLLTGVSAGQVVQVDLSASFDTYLQLVDGDTGELITFNDDSGSGLNSQLAFTVQEGIDYIIRATSYDSEVTGNYTLETQLIDLPDGYSLDYGYGLVNAAAAVAAATGQTTPFPNVPNLGGDSWGLDLVNAPEVWAQGYTGAGVVVAVVDTGVDYTHIDLDANIWVNSDEVVGNGIDDDGNGFVDDVRGWNFVNNNNNPMDLNDHGTHVAGTISAENNGIGVTGVAYNARIMPVRVLDADGFGTNANIAAGIRYAANNGADVINLSLGGGYSSAIASAVQYAAELGAVVVMAAGNEYGNQPGYPAHIATDFGIAVGAVDIDKHLADFSNRAGATPLDYVVAPGVDVLSTIPGNRYDSFSGTSMATPHVAGVAALMLSANSTLAAAEVESILTHTANPAGITV